MQFFSMDYLMHMQTLPKIDRKILGYGLVWALAIGAGVVWLVV